MNSHFYFTLQTICANLKTTSSTLTSHVSKSEIWRRERCCLRLPNLPTTVSDILTSSTSLRCNYSLSTQSLSQGNLFHSAWHIFWYSRSSINLLISCLHLLAVCLLNNSHFICIITKNLILRPEINLPLRLKLSVRQCMTAASCILRLFWALIAYVLTNYSDAVVYSWLKRKYVYLRPKLTSLDTDTVMLL